eukprot:2121706-Rhodomonas_salina.2
MLLLPRNQCQLPRFSAHPVPGTRALIFDSAVHFSSTTTRIAVPVYMHMYAEFCATQLLPPYALSATVLRASYRLSGTTHLEHVYELRVLRSDAPVLRVPGQRDFLVAAYGRSVPDSA